MLNKKYEVNISFCQNVHFPFFILVYINHPLANIIGFYLLVYFMMLYYHPSPSVHNKLNIEPIATYIQYSFAKT